ncbi:uncharacterized protein LOC107263405 isoform X2 [Cephus cinctus]|uniref:Uncharacterized protein LOC107263405 isoform X2 n=1 Tax=Cephus cinctus TaxID=211228 RepID=A0AAJ7R908_CEPCN|nr:uncharacterized protein LOC107263405 isoform X2 [Cephus cinctus]
MSIILDYNYKDRRFKSDEVFKSINQKYVTLESYQVKRNNVYLKEVIYEFLQRMRECDAFFKDNFQEIKWVGSFYKGTRFGSPEEFDLNIIIKLPINYNTINIQSDRKCKSFIKIQLKDDTLRSKLMPYKVLKKFVNNDLYLNQNEFRQWMESVVTKALLSLPTDCGKSQYLIINNKKYTIRVSKNSPAFTLYINVEGVTLDVDLVAAMEFTDPPPAPFRKITQKEKTWRAIAKPFHNGNMPNTDIVWRPFFYEQEREILQCADVKPVIRQMKKFRDIQGLHSIASYYIESLFYWEIEKRNKDKDFLAASKTCIFFNMLKRFYEATMNGEIKDFWHKEYNLLSKIGAAEMLNIQGLLKRIIITIERNIENDPYIIAKFILSKRELEKLQNQLVCVTREEVRESHNSPTTQSLNGTIIAVGTAIAAVMAAFKYLTTESNKK